MKLTWFMAFIDICWSIQGILNNLALSLSSSLLPSDKEEFMKIKFVVYRYLTVYHFLLYQCAAQEYQPPPPLPGSGGKPMEPKQDLGFNLADLEECGLLTVRERQLLEERSDCPRNVVAMWLCAIFSQLHKEGTLDSKDR